MTGPGMADPAALVRLSSPEPLSGRGTLLTPLGAGPAEQWGWSKTPAPSILQAGSWEGSWGSPSARSKPVHRPAFSHSPQGQAASCCCCQCPSRGLGGGIWTLQKVRSAPHPPPCASFMASLLPSRGQATPTPRRTEETPARPCVRPPWGSPSPAPTCLRRTHRPRRTSRRRR